MAPEIPKEQWAQVFSKTGGPIEYKKIPVPTPGPDEVLVNIKYTGVCHTDLHALKGDWPLVSSSLHNVPTPTSRILISNAGHETPASRRPRRRRYCRRAGRPRQRRRGNNQGFRASDLKSHLQ